MDLLTTFIMLSLLRAAKTRSLSLIYLFRELHVSCVPSLHKTRVVNRVGSIFINKYLMAKPIILPIEQFGVVGTNTTSTKFY